MGAAKPDVTNVYRRWPLTRGTGQFRILVLHPSTNSDKDPIHGSLIVAKLKKEKGNFETLSYVWGNSALPKSIVFIDNIPLQVTTSLAFFLRYLRRTDRPLRLWADGICINQNDDDEKSEQVALMADIYKSCSQVNVWLPEPTDAINNTAPKSKNSRGLGDLFSLLSRKHFHGIPGYSVAEDTRKLTFAVTDEFNALWKGFSLLANSSWWTRAWTAQEIFLPPRVVFLHFEAASCDMQVLDDGHERLWQHRRGKHSCCNEAMKLFPEDTMTQLSQFFQIFAQVQHRREVLFGRRSTDGRDCFYNVVTVLSNRQCFEARDRIYSLWSVTPSMYKDCPIDYAVAEGTAFTSIFECMLREAHLSRGHLNNLLGWGIDYRILQWMSFGPDTTGSDSRPSWVPDFSRRWSNHSLQAHRDRIAFSKLYQPAGFSKGHVEVRGRQLHLDCFPMDKIRLVGEAVEDPRNNLSLKKTLCQWKRLLKENGIYDSNTNNAASQRLATLLCAEVYGERMPSDQWSAWTRKFVVQKLRRGKLFEMFFEYAFNVIARDECWRRLRVEDLPRRRELDAFLDSGDLKCFEDSCYRSVVNSSLSCRALYITECGRIGLCLPHANAGDEIWGVYGFRVPFVFRALDRDEESVHNMIGDCYLQGAMDGELLLPGSSTVVKLV